jgi:DNA-binding beta-propeller fold protein YncE
MNKLNNFWLICFSSLALVFAACDDDAPETPAATERALILVNQGNFTPGNGTIDLYDLETSTMEQGAYRTVNGEAVGGSIESASIEGDNMVIMVNQNGGPGKVIFADAATLEKEHEYSSASNLYSPRYAAFTDNRIFVSVWGAYEPDYSLKNSSIAVFNRNSHQLEKSIPVPSGPEGVLVDGTNLWVANSFTDSITIINTGTLEIAQKFKTVSGTSRIMEAPGGKIWTLSGDTISRYNPSTFALESKVKLPGSATKWQFVGNNLYFLTQAYSDDYTTTYNKLYRLDVSQNGAQPQQVLEMDDARLFWIDPQTNEIYLGVAAGADPGTLLRLSADGTELDREPAGVFPHQFLAR